jgi:hypothetical protein
MSPWLYRFTTIDWRKISGHPWYIHGYGSNMVRFAHKIGGI